MKKYLVSAFAIFFGVIVSVVLAIIVGIFVVLASLTAYWRGLFDDINKMFQPEIPTETKQKSIWDIHQEKLDAKRPK